MGFVARTFFCVTRALTFLSHIYALYIEVAHLHTYLACTHAGTHVYICCKPFCLLLAVIEVY